MTTVPSSFSSTSARSASENVTTSPGFTRFAGRHHVSHVAGSRSRVSRNSIGFFICPFGSREETRRDDARVVEDEHVAVAEAVGEAGEGVVLDARPAA